MRSIKVLEVVMPPEPGRTRYIDQVVDADAPDLEYEYFSWPRALFTRYDVMHVHWPEKMLRARRPAVALVKRILMRALLVKLRLTGTPIVRTLHNIEPHESGTTGERRLLDLLDERTSWFIRLNDATPLPTPGRPATTILHADYVAQYEGLSDADIVPGRLLHFGHMRPYKGIERLIETFESVTDSTLSLRFAGEAKDEALRRVIERAQSGDARISAIFGFLDDRDLAKEIREAELVVLPYRNMHNSGALLLALSVGRPVLAPWSVVNGMIRDEVGPDWLHLYEGELSAEILSEAVAASSASRAGRGGRPEMPTRRWDVVRQAHSDLFRHAAARGRTGRATLRARAER